MLCDPLCSALLLGRCFGFSFGSGGGGGSGLFALGFGVLRGVPRVNDLPYRMSTLFAPEIHS